MGANIHHKHPRTQEGKEREGRFFKASRGKSASFFPDEEVIEESKLRATISEAHRTATISANNSSTSPLSSAFPS